MASLPWAPLRGPLTLADRLVESFGEPRATIGALAVGAVAALVLAFTAEQECLVVSHDRVATRRGGAPRKIERDRVGAVSSPASTWFCSAGLARSLPRRPRIWIPPPLGVAFLVRGYPRLAGGDPYKDDCRVWVEDKPDLPPAADALLGARARALGEGRDDAAEFRAELARLGIVVRDEK